MTNGFACGRERRSKEENAMWNIRTSVPEDIPAQRQLWKLAFGDEDAYIDNFYQT